MFNLLLGNSTSFSFPFPLSFVVGVFVDDVGIDLALLELGVPENWGRKEEISNWG